MNILVLYSSVLNRNGVWSGRCRPNISGTGPSGRGNNVTRYISAATTGSVQCLRKIQGILTIVRTVWLISGAEIPRQKLGGTSFWSTANGTLREV